MKRIICHWTGGRYSANSTDKKHYHFLFEGNGNEVVGKWPIYANEKIKKGRYAAHTFRCNTGSIGLSLACMFGATKNAFGSFPMNEIQFMAMCRKSAKLCLEYNIPVTNKTVLSHAEVQNNLGIEQRQKWDFTVLPFKPELRGEKACGDYLRKMVLREINLQSAVSNLINDADIAPYKSTTNFANLISGGGGLSALGGLFAFITNPYVQGLLIVAIFAVLLSMIWIFKERIRKAALGKLARGE